MALPAQILSCSYQDNSLNQPLSTCTHARETMARIFTSIHNSLQEMVFGLFYPSPSKQAHLKPAHLTSLPIGRDDGDERGGHLAPINSCVSSATCDVNGVVTGNAMVLQNPQFQVTPSKRSTRSIEDATTFTQQAANR